MSSAAGSLNSSKPLSSDGSVFKMPEQRKGSGRNRGGQPGHLAPSLFLKQIVHNEIRHSKTSRLPSKKER